MKSKRGTLAMAFAFVAASLLSACSGTGGSALTAGSANGKTATVTLKIVVPSAQTAANTADRGGRSAQLRTVLSTTKSLSVTVTGGGNGWPVGGKVVAAANMGVNGAVLTISGVPTGTARTFTVAAWDAPAAGTCPGAACTAPTASATVHVISFGSVVTDVYPGTNQVGINLWGLPTKVLPATATLAVGPNGSSTQQQFYALDKDGNYLVNGFATTGFTSGANCQLYITATTSAAPFAPGPITAATVFVPGTGYNEGDLIVLNDFQGNFGTGSGNALAQVVSLVNTTTFGGVTTGGVGSVSILYPGTFYYSSEKGSGLKLNITAGSGSITAATVGTGNGGAGYAPGDLLNVAGGNGNGLVQVATVGAGGAVATVNIINGGLTYSTATAVATNLTTTTIATTHVWVFPMVEWKVNGNSPAASLANGSIDLNGNYTPPSALPASTAVTVSAMSALGALPPATAAVTLNGGTGITIGVGGTVPPAPVLTATSASPTPQGSVNLTWPAVTMPAGSAYPVFAYYVWYNTNPSLTGPGWVGPFYVSGTSLTVPNLLGIKYYFIVQALNNEGASAPSNEASATPVFTNITANPLYVPADPLYGNQWHLFNSGAQLYADGLTTAGPGGIGNDLDVEKVWSSFRGNGVRVAVVDVGMDLLHEDLAANVVAGASYDYTLNWGAGAQVPAGGNLIYNGYYAPGIHGTMVAGIVAAAEGNNLGGVGVAPSANLVGYNFLEYGSYDNMSDAMVHDLANNSIYTNSWGQQNGYGYLIPEPSTWQAAVDTGNATGRGGKGSVYTFAAGNGGSPGFWDRSDYNGLANFRGVIAVGALTDLGVKTSYSEQGSNLLVSAYAGEFCDTHTITTTDIMGIGGENAGSTPIPYSAFLDYANPNYTECMNGTSAATPEVAGVVALMLQANPNLTWRDVRIILAETARLNDPADILGWGSVAPGWGTNGAGLHVNDSYGYGAVDATAAVNAALTWTSVGGSSTLKSITGTNNTPTALIPDGGAFGTYGAPVTTTITLNGTSGTAMTCTTTSGVTTCPHINNIEFVEVTVTSDHPYDSDLKITLTSPLGTTSILTVVRPYSDGSLQAGYTFGVARLINEPANGTWTLTAADGWVIGQGHINSWGLKVYGH